jgi:hypothetical protein
MSMTAKRNKKKMRFKLLVGCHWGFLPDSYDAMTDEALRELAEQPEILAALADKGQKILPADGREAVLKKLRLVNQGMYRENGDGAGNIIETDTDLCAVHNARGKHPKYERLEDRPTRGHVWDPATETIDEFSARMRGAAPPIDEDAEASASDSEPHRGDEDEDLDALPNLELRQIAKDRGINLHGVSSKKDIIARIRGEAVTA